MRTLVLSFRLKALEWFIMGYFTKNVNFFLLSIAGSEFKFDSSQKIIPHTQYEQCAKITGITYLA